MQKLTRYDSWEALKSDTNRTVASEQEIKERHLALKRLLEKLIANYLAAKRKQEEPFRKPADTEDKWLIKRLPFITTAPSAPPLSAH